MDYKQNCFNAILLPKPPERKHRQATVSYGWFCCVASVTPTFPPTYICTYPPYRDALAGPVWSTSSNPYPIPNVNRTKHTYYTPYSVLTDVRPSRPFRSSSASSSNCKHAHRFYALCVACILPQPPLRSTVLYILRVSFPPGWVNNTRSVTRYLFCAIFVCPLVSVSACLLSLYLSPPFFFVPHLFLPKPEAQRASRSALSGDAPPRQQDCPPLPSLIPLELFFCFGVVARGTRISSPSSAYRVCSI